jgi:hypothetical protein
MGIGKKRSTTKTISIAIAGVLIASVVAASVSISNAQPFRLTPAPDNPTDAHDPKLLAMHSHVHVQLFVDGQQIALAANIGIDEALHSGHSLDKYAVGSQMAPMHTHSNDGLIHLESSVMRDYTMGEFMAIWGVDLDEIRTISVTVDGRPVQDYENLVLKDGQQIILQIGL